MTRMGKRGWIAIGIAAILIVAAVVTAIILILRKNYTPVDQIDLNEYSLVGVEFERDYYLNEPQSLRNTSLSERSRYRKTGTALRSGGDWTFHG